MLGPLLGRLLRLVVVLLLVVVVAAGGLLTLITVHGLPQTSGSLKLAGLHAAAAIYRDANGIAQVVADDAHDLFMAQGYLHASERFWQMEVYRRAGSGTLSELFGKSTVAQDTFVRTLGLRRAAQRDLDAESPEGKAALQAYADGVNDWISAHRGSLGLPFVVVGLKAGLGGGLGGYDPQPWTPLDSTTFAKLQALVLGGNFDSEVFRQAADARLGDRALTDQLFPAYPADAPIEVPTGAAGSGGAGAPTGNGSAPAGAGALANGGDAAAGDDAAAGATVTDADATAADATGADAEATAAGWLDLGRVAQSVLAITGLDRASGFGSDHGIGSNDWVVGPSRSKTGHALLANDPHLGLDMPSVWVMNGLHCRVPSPACAYDVIGVSFPSVPSVILGHNERIAWGATNVGPDVQDLFQEQLDPNDKTHYMFKGQSIPFEVRHEVLKVAGGEDVAIDVRSTGHGPVISDASDRLKAVGGVYALRWTATTEPDRIFDAFLALDRASDWTSFRAALAVYGAPSQNFVYADVDGHIGLQVPGLVPIRQDAKDLGDRPVPGWTGTHEWTGYVKYDDLPRLFDPPSGFIATANAAAVDAKFPYLIGREWDPGYRVGRIAELLNAAARTGGVTRDAMSAIQMDTFVPRARLVIDRIGDIVPATDDGRTLLARIRSWNGQCDVGSLGCAAYMTFEYHVLRGLFDPRLGLDIARDYVGSTDSWQALIALLDQRSSPWWDDPRTPATETRSGVVSAAVDAAAADLRATFGDPAGWTWGREHTITFEEGTLGGSGLPVITWYFNAGPFPVAGAAGAVDNTYYNFAAAYPDPTDPTYVPGGLRQVFDVTNGPSYRLDTDMGDLDGARIVITTGQSGNPFDRHYGDMIQAWLTGGQVPLPFSPGAAQKATVATLTLTP
jgi:penicillin amidase